MEATKKEKKNPMNRNEEKKLQGFLQLNSESEMDGSSITWISVVRYLASGYLHLIFLISFVFINIIIDVCFFAFVSFWWLEFILHSKCFAMDYLRKNTCGSVILKSMLYIYST